MTNFWTEVMIYLDNAPLYSLEEIHIWNSVKSNVVQNIFANLKSLISQKSRFILGKLKRIGPSGKVATKIKISGILH